MEWLLRRVIRRGSKPAITDQYGSGDEFQIDFEAGGNFTISPSALATTVEIGLVSIDPGTGFHFTSHLDCITSSQKYGFVPFNNSGEPYQGNGRPIQSLSFYQLQSSWMLFCQ
jgi:hypothetical protein